MHRFEVHSNESACRKKVRLGLEQVFDELYIHVFVDAEYEHNKVIGGLITGVFQC